ncbi:radical SAM protein [bacterium]
MSAKKTSDIRTKLRIGAEERVTDIFSLLYETAREDEAKKAVSDTRKVLKAGPLLSRVAKARLVSKEVGKPFMFHHYVTMRCNCSCEQCLWKDNKAEEMTLDEIKNFYRQAAEEGFIFMLLGGGEPLLRNDIGEIFRYGKKECGFRIGTATNGFFLEKKIEEYGEYVDAILVSIDSADPAKHDEIRGVKGLFDRVMRGIEKVKTDFPFIHLIANACIDDNSVDEIESIIELTGELDIPLNVDVITTGQNISGEGHVDKKSHMVGSYDRISEALHIVMDAKKRGAKIFNSEYYMTHFDGGKQHYECRYPRMFLRVMANGDVEDCLRVGDPIANLRTTPLAEILESDRLKKLQEEAEKCSICSSPTIIDYSRYWNKPMDMLVTDSPLRSKS